MMGKSITKSNVARRLLSTIRRPLHKKRMKTSLRNVRLAQKRQIWPFRKKLCAFSRFQNSPKLFDGMPRALNFRLSLSLSPKPFWSPIFRALSFNLLRESWIGKKIWARAKQKSYSVTHPLPTKFAAGVSNGFLTRIGIRRVHLPSVMSTFKKEKKILLKRWR